MHQPAAAASVEDPTRPRSHRAPTSRRTRTLGGVLAALVLTGGLFLGVALPAHAAPRPLVLTSSSCPVLLVHGTMTSGCVTELQNLLNRDGARLRVDGDFGALTLAAVQTFQRRHGLVADGVVGPLTKRALYATTAGSPPPPSGAGSTRTLAVAGAEVGVREGSARANGYGAAVGYSQSTTGYAWCAAFVSWVMRQSGATTYRSASVGDWVAAARSGRSGLSVTTAPRPGDLVAFDWDGNGDYALGNRHIGIVSSTSGRSFTTIEGNTSGPSGDGVYRRSRASGGSYSTLFIRVG